MGDNYSLYDITNDSIEKSQKDNLGSKAKQLAETVIKFKQYSSVLSKQEMYRLAEEILKEFSK